MRSFNLKNIFKLISVLIVVYAFTFFVFANEVNKDNISTFTPFLAPSTIPTVVPKEKSVTPTTIPSPTMTEQLPTFTPQPTTEPSLTPTFLPTFTTVPQSTNIPAPSGMFGPPSLWPDDIDSILYKIGSPAAGNGSTFWQLGVDYGIDPAYLLAFFNKESSMGTDPNWRQTNNIGNIICTQSWTGQCLGRFRVYTTWAESAENWYFLMSNKYYGQDIFTIMSQYAPVSDGNNPDRYARQVLQLVEQWGTR